MLGRGAAPTPRPAWRYLFKKLAKILGEGTFFVYNNVTRIL
jgi:hypothetical protein